MSGLAKHLLRNPVPCGVSAHEEPSAATRILEAQVPAYISDHPLNWILCDAAECEEEARKQADSYLPIGTDLRDATVNEIETVSGLSVTGELDAQVDALIALAVADTDKGELDAAIYEVATAGMPEPVKGPGWRDESDRLWNAYLALQKRVYAEADAQIDAAFAAAVASVRTKDVA